LAIAAMRWQSPATSATAVLLPGLGIGPFILPHFFGTANQLDFPKALVPAIGWARKAALTLQNWTEAAFEHYCKYSLPA